MWEVAAKTGFPSVVFVTKWSETGGKGHMLSGDGETENHCFKS